MNKDKSAFAGFSICAEHHTKARNIELYGGPLLPYLRIKKKNKKINKKRKKIKRNKKINWKKKKKSKKKKKKFKTELKKRFFHSVPELP